MWFIRRMLRISWTEKKPNVNVLREGNVQRSLLKTIRKRQMEFLGHVCRCRGLEWPPMFVPDLAPDDDDDLRFISICSIDQAV